MTERKDGALTERERESAGRESSAHRQAEPEDVFLLPGERKYPVKVERDGKWTYDRGLLLAAAREARMHGHSDLADRADAIRAREFGGASDGRQKPATELLAFDRESVRRFDRDGRLHVEVANISKATVNDYLGRDVPRWRELGLDPARHYALLRSPEALAKAAPTFNNIPILDRHVPHTADQPRQGDTIGTTGSDCRFEAPYLRASLAFWVGGAIDDVVGDERRQLSCSYHYRPVVEAGTYEGRPYDIRMEDIVGNHVALVEEGRAGPDVMVGDSMPRTHTTHTTEMTKMPKAAKSLTTKARIVQGALAAFLAPRMRSDLANDQMPDLKPVVLGTTAQNYQSAKPIIIRRLEDATRGKLAADAYLKDAVRTLDSLDAEGEEEGGVEEMQGQSGDPDPQERTDNGSVEDAEEPHEKMLKHLEGKVPPELIEELRGMCPSAEDEDPEPQPETEEKLRGMDKAARDKVAGFLNAQA